MITYAKFPNLMAYLINHSMSGLCKIYLGRNGLIIFSSLFSIALLTLSNSSVAGEKITIPMDLSNWTYKGNKFECNLMHSNIPQGKFYFLAEPNSQISFIADVRNNNNKWNSAVLSSENAPWSNELYTKDGALVEYKLATNRFKFSHGADALLEQVASGRWVTLSLDGSNPSAISAVTLPTIRMQSALESFNQCRARLPKLSFSQARDINLLFNFGQDKLSLKQSDTLVALYSYVSVDERVTKILIDGYTDNVGSQLANLSVSRQRAQQVADALVALGAERSMIEIRAHGARYPIASNNTSAGQAKNRRVTLRLVRDNERVIAKNRPEVKQPQQEKVKVQ